jgi:hypothetical protein
LVATSRTFETADVSIVSVNPALALSLLRLVPGSFPLALEAVERLPDARVAAGAAFFAGAVPDAVFASFGALASTLLFTCVFGGLATDFVAAVAVFFVGLPISTTDFAGLAAGAAGLLPLASFTAVPFAADFVTVAFIVSPGYEHPVSAVASMNPDRPGAALVMRVLPNDYLRCCYRRCRHGLNPIQIGR